MLRAMPLVFDRRAPELRPRRRDPGAPRGRAGPRSGAGRPHARRRRPVRAGAVHPVPRGGRRGDAAIVGASIRTFGAFTDKIAAATGAELRPQLSDAQRLALVRAAVRQTQLGVLSGSAARRGFAPALERLISELQSSLITAGELASAAAELEDGAYESELARLYEAYVGGRDAAGRDDAHSAVRKVAISLRERPRAWGARPVLLYGFDDLTEEQLELVAALTGACQVTVAVNYEDREALAPRAALLARLRDELGGVEESRLAFEELYTQSADPAPPRPAPVRGRRRPRRARRRDRDARMRRRARRGRGGRRRGRQAARRRSSRGRHRGRPAAPRSPGAPVRARLRGIRDPGRGRGVRAAGSNGRRARPRRAGAREPARGGRRGAARLHAGPPGRSAGNRRLGRARPAARRGAHGGGADRRLEGPPLDARRASRRAARRRSGFAPWPPPRTSSPRRHTPATSRSRGFRRGAERARPCPSRRSSCAPRRRRPGRSPTSPSWTRCRAARPPLPPRRSSCSRTFAFRCGAGPAEGRVRVLSPYRARAARARHLFVASLQDGEFPGGDTGDPAARRRAAAAPRHRGARAAGPGDRGALPVPRLRLPPDRAPVALLAKLRRGGPPRDPVAVRGRGPRPARPGARGGRGAAEAGPRPGPGRLRAHGGARRPRARARPGRPRAADRARTSRARSRTPGCSPSCERRDQVGPGTIERWIECPYRWFVDHELKPQRLEPAARSPDHRLDRPQGARAPLLRAARRRPDSPPGRRRPVAAARGGPARRRRPSGRDSSPACPGPGS